MFAHRPGYLARRHRHREADINTAADHAVAHMNDTIVQRQSTVFIRKPDAERSTVRLQTEVTVIKIDKRILEPGFPQSRKQP